jgi:tetratricopeptide (TPR) repeat protein
MSNTLNFSMPAAFLTRPIIGSLLALSLLGCASTSMTAADSASPDMVIEANPDQIRVVTDRELANDPLLPKLDLNAKLLEKLLVMNLASFNGDWDQATDNAREAAEATQDYRVARLATMLAMRKDDYGGAADMAKLWYDLKPESEDAHNMLLMALVGAGQTSEAIDVIEAALKQRDINEYIKQLAALLVRQKNDVSGFAIASYLVEENPGSAQVLLSSAYVAESFNLMEAAQAWVDQAMALRPSWDLAAQMKANLLYSQERLDERAEFISQFVADNPKSIAMRINHAAELARAEKFSEAYSLMKAVLKDAPDNVGALQYAGALAEVMDESNKAQHYYRRVLQYEPSNDDVRWSLGRMAATRGQFARAEQLFRDIQQSDMLFRAQIQVANMRFETDGVDAAVDYLWGLEPTTNNEWLELVETRHFLLMRAFRYEEALGYINEAIVYVPNQVDLLYARSLVAAELGRVALAEQDLRAVLAQQPEHANALNALGYTLADRTDRYAEARELIEKALALRPNDAHILDSMGWVLYRLKEYKQAITYLERAYEASPEVEIAAHLGEVLWEAGEQERATLVWERSYREHRDNPLLNKTLKRYGVEFSTHTVSKQ